MTLLTKRFPEDGTFDAWLVQNMRQECMWLLKAGAFSILSGVASYSPFIIAWNTDLSKLLSDPACQSPGRPSGQLEDSASWGPQGTFSCQTRLSCCLPPPLFWMGSFALTPPNFRPVLQQQLPSSTPPVGFLPTDLMVESEFSPNSILNSSAFPDSLNITGPSDLFWPVEWDEKWHPSLLHWGR